MLIAIIQSERHFQNLLNILFHILDFNIAYLTTSADVKDIFLYSTFPFSDFPQGRSSHHVDVETWLRSLGLESVEHYIQIFNDHQMDMSRVQLLSATDLREMGIHAIGPIMKIMKGVLVLGRENSLLCGSCDYINNGGNERHNWDPAARSVDNHTDRFDLTEMSTEFNHALNNDTKSNNMCKKEHGCNKTFSRALSSPVLHTNEPGQNGVINNSGDYSLAKLDLGTTADVKISDDDNVAVNGVTRVGDGMLKESSRPKQTVNRRQSSAKRRGKQPVVGVSGKPPINNNGECRVIIYCHLFHGMEDTRQDVENKGNPITGTASGM